MLLKIEKALPSWLEALALDASSRTGSRRISTSTVKKDRKLLEETVISRQKQEETRGEEGNTTGSSCRLSARRHVDCAVASWATTNIDCGWLAGRLEFGLPGDGLRLAGCQLLGPLFLAAQKPTTYFFESVGGVT